MPIIVTQGAVSPQRFSVFTTEPQVLETASAVWESGLFSLRLPPGTWVVMTSIDLLGDDPTWKFSISEGFGKLVPDSNGMCFVCTPHSEVTVGIVGKDCSVLAPSWMAAVRVE